MAVTVACGQLLEILSAVAEFYMADNGTPWTGDGVALVDWGVRNRILQYRDLTAFVGNAQAFRVLEFTPGSISQENSRQAYRKAYHGR